MLEYTSPYTLCVDLLLAQTHAVEIARRQGDRGSYSTESADAEAGGDRPPLVRRQGWTFRPLLNLFLGAFLPSPKRQTACSDRKRRVQRGCCYREPPVVLQQYGSFREQGAEAFDEGRALGWDEVVSVCVANSRHVYSSLSVRATATAVCSRILWASQPIFQSDAVPNTSKSPTHSGCRKDAINLTRARTLIGLRSFWFAPPPPLPLSLSVFFCSPKLSHILSSTCSH